MQAIDVRRCGSMAALSCFYLAFLGGEYLFDQRVAMFAEASTVALAESVVVGISVVGFLLYPVALRFAAGARRPMLRVAAVVGAICLAMLGVVQSAALAYAAGSLALLCLGFVGAAAHDAVAKGHAGSLGPVKGPAGAVGVAYATAILLQVVLQALTGDGLLRAVILAFVCAASGVLATSRDADAARGVGADAKDSAACPDGAPAFEARTLPLLVLAVALMTCVFSTLNVTLTRSHAAGMIDLGSWPRLFLAASALAAGFTFDGALRHRAPIVMVLVSTFSCFAIFSAFAGGPIVLSAAVFYLGSGAFVVFFTSAFMRAGRDIEPAGLWPSVGRVTNNAVSLAVAAPALALVSEAHELSASAVVLVVLAGIYATVFLLQEREAEALRVSVAVAEKDDAPADGSDGAERSVVPRETVGTPATFDPAQKLSAYAAAFGLTPRETEVLEALTTSDASMQDVARGLYISRSALYRHISSICARVGVQNRQALLLHYFSWDAGPERR